MLEAFERLRSEGLVEHLGLTGIGNPESLRTVVRSGKFQTMQIPYHVLNPSAGQPMDPTRGNKFWKCDRRLHRDADGCLRDSRLCRRRASCSIRSRATHTQDTILSARTVRHNRKRASH